METKRQEPGKAASSKSQSAKTKKGKKSEEAKQETPKTPPKRLKLVSPLREKASQVNVERLLRKNIEMMSQKLGHSDGEPTNKERGSRSPLDRTSPFRSSGLAF
jgi:hypothetical protein